jgi:selenocysteine-specific elongation factor
MYVVGTAGHVDHGKSTLVRALTGIDPDRLKEEKEREMTIDLGFAWLELPSGQEVSIVDVPGHEDFIKNMLAGVGGIDAVLLTVAADEAIMPQTREHVAILDLLEVKAGLVVLTKADMVPDEEWLELVKMDVASLLEKTSLAGAPIVLVSSKTGKGLIDLEDNLDALLKKTPPRRDFNRPRLSIDRIFTKPGFGTIVTGTLIDGRFCVGDEIEIQPKGLKGRIRGLQTHKNKVEVATPGSRVAINLTGVNLENLSRGDVVTHRGWLSGTVLVDARIRVLEDFELALRHDMEIEIFSGASQVLGHARVLGADEIRPGELGWVQIRLVDPIALVKGDRLILRQPSPSRTIGGGVVIDPHPYRKHRRYHEEVIRHLGAMASDTPEEILLATLMKQEPISARLAVQRSQLDLEAAGSALSKLLAEGLVYVLNSDTSDPGKLVSGSSNLISAEGFNRFVERIRQVLSEYHTAFPLRLGLPREELNSRLGLDRQLVNTIVERAVKLGSIRAVGGSLSLPGHKVLFSPEQQRQINQALEVFRQAPFTPPPTREVASLIGTEVLFALLEQGCLTQVSKDVVFMTDTYNRIIEQVVQHLKEQGTITIAEARDLFNTSRKYTQAILEHMDEKRITKRLGDNRILRQMT